MTNLTPHGEEEPNKISDEDIAEAAADPSVGWEEVTEEDQRKILDAIGDHGLGFICCFCGGHVDPGDPHLAVGIFDSSAQEEEDDIYQQFFAHPNCVHETLHEKVRTELRDEIKEMVNENSDS